LLSFWKESEKERRLCTVMTQRARESRDVIAETIAIIARISKGISYYMKLSEIQLLFHGPVSSSLNFEVFSLGTLWAR
jgi:hypothetical protein